MELAVDRIESPIGPLTLAAETGVLRLLWFDAEPAEIERAVRRYYGPARLAPVRDPAGLSSRLRAYFDGAIAAIDDIPARGAGSPFQERVWAALRTIPAGTTLSYGALAGRIGQPTASRAVGLANGANPISIVVPCHRVIGSDGSLTGYGGGLERKRWLLAHEGVAAGVRTPDLFAA